MAKAMVISLSVVRPDYMGHRPAQQKRRRLPLGKMPVSGAAAATPTRLKLLTTEDPLSFPTVGQID
jgi:hypothetical protein